MSTVMWCYSDAYVFTFRPFQALHYLVLISEVDEVEIFKICLEYWNGLSADLYRECPLTPQSPLCLARTNSAIPPRRMFYSDVLTKVG
jgi:exportin-1